MSVNLPGALTRIAMFERTEAKNIATELEEPVIEARNLAQKLGLEPYPVNYWIVNQDEMNELIAYGGFHTRYPHWRWGMQYDRQQKQSQFGMGKAFEIVNHDDPSNAFLQESNTMADQKAVITHVEAHADFFAQNEWFHLFHENNVDAAAMIERHADRVEDIINDTDVDRAEVERWIDHLQTIEDNIDQHRSFEWTANIEEESTEIEPDDLGEEIEEALDLTDEVREEVFDEDWLTDQEADDEPVTIPPDPEEDLLLFLYRYGMQYDDDSAKAVEFEDWQREIIEIIREEAYYFAPQKMTKVMNEGWAAYWESMMMGGEAFANANEFISYADHQSLVLGSGGLNPYSLGIDLWKYAENHANRREVVRKLLRVDGIAWRNFHDKVDFGHVKELLEPEYPLHEIGPDTLDDLESLGDERVDIDAIERAREGEIDVEKYPWKVLTYEGLAERHFSLTRPENYSFLDRIDRSQLEEIARYLMDIDRYDTVEEAIADIDYAAGWNRMFEIRESHNDVTFIDEYLTQEFVDEQGFFTYEHSEQTGNFHAASDAVDDVKKKLLLQFTNFGKPTITVRDGNFNNRGELLLSHEYNGVMLHMPKARDTLKRIFEMWGRPVNLMTIVKEVNEEELEIARRRGREPQMDENGKLIRYDGDQFDIADLDAEMTEEIMADDVDYDTKPEDWL